MVILIDNAMRYTPQGGSITISATQAKERILVTVSGYRLRIAQEDLPHVFASFKTDRSRREAARVLVFRSPNRSSTNLAKISMSRAIRVEGTSFHFTLKNYISNAIALGPVNAGIVIHEEPRDVIPIQTNLQDAPYEVLPKKQSEKKSSKPETKSTSIRRRQRNDNIAAARSTRRLFLTQKFYRNKRNKKITPIMSESCTISTSCRVLLNCGRAHTIINSNRRDL
ncbi:MAG: ATP-binding protein [Eubacteriales bacterium]